MTDFGGRAMCPADEYNDPAVREEMILHAVEAAFADAELDPCPETWLLDTLTRDARDGAPPIGADAYRYRAPRYLLELRATSDEHLLDGGGNGTVDLTATLTPA